MRVKTLVTLTLALSLLAAPAFIGAQAPAPIVIPAILSLTGNGAFPGKGDQQSLVLIEALVNKSGGIGRDHRPIHFDITDDGSNPQTAVQLQNAILTGKSPIMVGPSLTQQCNAVTALVAQAGPMQYCLSPAIRITPGGFIFSSSSSLQDQNTVAVRYFRQRGLTRMAILSSTDATGQEADRNFAYAKSLRENDAVEIVAHEHFNLTDVSVTAQMSRIKAAKPQVLLTSTVGPAFGTELHGVSDVGLDVPVFGSSGDMVPEQLESYKAFIPRELYFSGVLSSVPNGVTSGPVKDAQTVYFAAFKAAGIKPIFTNTLGWDPTMIVVDALKHLGPSATAQQYREYLNGLHGFAGINGIYDFRDGSGHGIGQNSLLMTRWDPASGDFTRVSKRSGYL